MICVLKWLSRKALRSSNQPRRANSQQGYLMIWSILMIAFGSLVILGLLSFANVSLRATDSTLMRAEEYFTADAAVMAVLADLVQGTDILDVGYTKPSVTLNNYSANITISAAIPGSGPPVYYRYFDPRASGNLTPLINGGSYNFQLDNVVAASDFRVHWAFTPAAESWSLTVYEGVGTGGTLVATDNLTLGPGYLSIDGSLISGDTYTVNFHNTSDDSTNSASFNANGGTDYTWIYTRAKKDYLITATAGSTPIKAYVRQEPGPTVSPDASPTVTILSWQAPAE